MSLETQLQFYFGYRSFREGQKEIIETIMDKQDLLAVLPTGTGKSICYQLPALLLEGTAIVVSPLLSLMEDQVQQLHSIGIKKVAALNSFLSWEERQFVLKRIHQYKLLYVSPEILQSHFVLEKLKMIPISMFVVDEAHCISQWGHEFRTDYLKLKEVRKQVGQPPCLALTATATKEIQQDIIEHLHLHNEKKIIHSVDRKNIALHVEQCDSAIGKVERLTEFVNGLQGPGMVYFSSRQLAEKMAEHLQQNGNQRITYYHGGLRSEDRILIQQQFMNGQLDVVCCTSAFGMGINKQDVRYVIHFHFPGQMEAYLQEIGRAGRDQKQSLAILLYTNDDWHVPVSLIEQELPSNKQIEQVTALLANTTVITPETERHIQQMAAIHENIWRYVKYQLEKDHILLRDGKVNKHIHFDSFGEKLKKIVEERKTAKMKKINEMERWVLQQDCRRKAYLRYFDEILNEKPEQCCDKCGLSLHLYEKIRKEENEKENTWRQDLMEIFHQTE
ncbi:ATP-dependent DNA helicase RecQ [Alkalihalobacillus sp. LMS39]|uniref:RecQ family ATP-dependent DNA helicase n=1 Tax=Alkalihalobacillus sp. LMS39 TaxID=2924032 RepID=UPI001FB3DBD7|nr:ATP-dependent DNA helicase RecQ [Alkalihalobacillus sp. LMS39]UOE92391.1 RecQ family ATP-dependent DNA helicase [Alkalihalobacillus sp. LMS39]